jgi:hypothetical protein
MFNSIIYERGKKISSNYKIDFFYLDDYLLNILFEKKRNNNRKKSSFILIFTLICHFQIIKQKKNIVIEFILISEAKDIITFTFTFFFFFVFMLRSLTRRRLFNREGACVSLLPIYNLEKRRRRRRRGNEQRLTHTYNVLPLFIVFCM